MTRVVLALSVLCCVAARGRAGSMVLSADDAIVATSDADGDVLVLMEADTLTLRARVPVAGRPGALLSLASGEIAVACADDAVVVFVDPIAARVTRWISTDVEPRALASDGRLLFVASFAAASVVAYDLEDGRRVWSAAVDPHPSALALDGRGSLFVSHLDSGRVDELDAAAGAVVAVHRLPNQATTQVQVMLAAGDTVLVPHITAQTKAASRRNRTVAYGGGGEGDMAAIGGLAWLGHDRQRRALTLHGLRWIDRSRALARQIQVPFRAPAPSMLDDRRLEPSIDLRAYGKYAFFEDTPSSPVSLVDAAVGPDGRIYLVDTALSSISVVARLDDTTSRGFALRTTSYAVAVGPTAVALDREGKRMFVAFAHTRTLAVAQVSALNKQAWLTRRYAAPELDEEVARGRILFHTLDTRVSKRGLTCASCHPDGRSDGRTWHQRDGARQTPVLVDHLDGRLHGTAPYGWLGQAATLAQHVTHTIETRLDGEGLQPSDLAALVAYLERGLIAAPRVERPAAQVANGSEVFARAGCASCHNPATRFTDGMRYDVGTRAGADVDVPSLVDVAQSAPYLHDGRAKTLRDVLATRDPKNPMAAGQLAPDELEALLAYLESI